jgi:chromosome segregation ATPase
MSSNPDLDAQLAEFLAACARDRDDGHTIANLRIEMHALRSDVNEVSARVHAHELRLDRHGREIRALKQRVDGQHDDTDTGVHQVEDLRRYMAERELAAKQAELTDRRRDSLWWKRKKVDWLAAIVGGAAVLTLGAIGTVAWFFVSHIVLGGK